MDRTKPRSIASAIITQDDESMHGNWSDSKEQIAVDITQKILSKMNTCGSRNMPWLTESALRKLMVGILEDNQHIFSSHKDSPQDLGNPEVIPSKAVLEHPLHTMPNGLDKVIDFTKTSKPSLQTTYHSPWIGTVGVIRQSTVRKTWKAKEEEFEIKHQKWQTYIYLKPASWLSQLGVDLRVQTTQAMYGSANITTTLEPVRYVDIPPAALHALHQGDIATVQHLLSAGEISLHDRDFRTGNNLLRIGLHHFGAFWYTDEEEKLAPSQLDIVSSSLWLLSQGLETEIQSDDSILSDWKFSEGMRTHGADVFVNVSNMERLLLEMTENVSPIMRAKKLLLFAMVNPDHSIHLESVIWDLLKDETPSEAELVLFKNAERKWWANGDLFINGMECMLLNSYLNIRSEVQRKTDDEPKSSAFEGSLKGPRRMLLGMMAWDQCDSLSHKDQVDFIANILGLSNRFTSILDDGFSDHVSTYACRLHKVDLWHDILDGARTSAKSHIRKHVTSDLTVQHPLHIRLGVENGSHTSTTLLARDPHASKDEGSDDLWESIESYSKSLYNSHGPKGNPSDICFVRQEGTELHFDCGITDPQHDREGHWEAEQQYWSEFEEANRRYTHKEFTEEETQVVESVSKPTPSFLSRLVSEGASIVTSIV